MIEDWELVHQESYPVALATASWHRCQMEFVTKDEMTAEELVTKAKELLEQNCVVLYGELWKPKDRGEKNRRWLSDITLAPRPDTYPQGNVTPQFWGWVLAIVGIGLGIWTFNKFSQTASQLTPLISMVMMMVMMPLMQSFTKIGE